MLYRTANNYIDLKWMIRLYYLDLSFQQIFTSIMTIAEFEFDTPVWAKIGSFHWWPAKVYNPKQIENEQDLPEFVLKQKPKNSTGISVFFFGSNEL